MNKKSSKKKSPHDKTVKKIATEFKKKGFDVKADLHGFKQPKPISGKIPDIVATKGRIKKIIEVETPQSNRKDREQQNVFKKSAQKSKFTTYKKVLTKSSKQKSKQKK